jgi:hypothetical protein
MGKACCTHEETRNAYYIWVEKPEGKRLLGRLGSKWDANIRIDLSEIE